MSETLQLKKKEYKQLAEAAKKLGFKDVDELVNTAIEHFICAELIEKEEVTVKIPKKLLVLLRDKRKDSLEEYLSWLLTDGIAADIHAGAFGIWDNIIEEYDLTEEFPFYQGH